MSSAKIPRAASPQTRTHILDSALTLITTRGGADVTMAEIATEANLSRQAVYLHFADRADLFVALARRADEKRNLGSEVQRITDAPTGVAALHEMAALQARMNPQIWAIARAFDAVRRVDEAAERSWQDRLQHRLSGCRAIIARLKREGTLREGLEPAAAADLLWTITSLRTWEDLVLQRGWSAAKYEERLTRLLSDALTKRRA